MLPLSTRYYLTSLSAFASALDSAASASITSKSFDLAPAVNYSITDATDSINDDDSPRPRDTTAVAQLVHYHDDDNDNDQSHNNQGVKSKRKQKVHLQVVQVEAGSSSSQSTIDTDEGSRLKNKKLREILHELRSEYEVVDFGTTSYFDKVQLGSTSMNGTGRIAAAGVEGESVLNNLQESLEVDNRSSMLYKDKCYTVNQRLSSSVDILPGINVSTDGPSRSESSSSSFNPSYDLNNFMNNQWDVLRRTALDETIGWDLRDSDDEGRQIIRMAVLVTEQGAHTSPSTFKEFPRNLSREQIGNYPNYSPLGGTFQYQWQSSISSRTTGTTQDCDINFKSYLGNDLETLESDEEDSSNNCFGPSTTMMGRSGVKRSYRGSMAFYNNSYGLGARSMINHVSECSNEGIIYEDCTEFAAFLDCCTRWESSSESSCSSILAEFPTFFPDFNSCIEYGGFYADGYYLNETIGEVVGEENRDNDNNDWLRSRYASPSPKAIRHFKSFLEPSSYFLEALETIEDYPYDQSIFDQNCSTFEYPDPSSAPYSLPFTSKGIVPVILAGPPSDKIMKVPGSSLASDLSSYDESALLMSEHNCPGLEWDPWTSFVCAASSSSATSITSADEEDVVFEVNHCIAPLVSEPPEYYPYYPTQSRWDTPIGPSNSVEGSVKFYELNHGLGCATEYCATKWWSDCMEVEFGHPVERMKENGVTNALYKPLKYGYTAEDLIKSLREAIDEIVIKTESTLKVSGNVDLIVEIDGYENYKPQHESEPLVDLPQSGPLITEYHKLEKIKKKTRQFHEQLRDANMNRRRTRINLDEIEEKLDESVDSHDVMDASDSNGGSGKADGHQPQEVDSDAPTQSTPDPDPSENLGMIIGCATGGIVMLGGITVGGLVTSGKLRLKPKSLPPLQTNDNDDDFCSFHDKEHQMVEVNAELFV